MKNLNLHMKIEKNEEVEASDITPENLNETNEFQETPLHLAIKYKRGQAIDLLLQQEGVNLRIQSYRYGTPLVAAAYFKDRETFGQILGKEKIDLQSNHPGVLVTAIRSGDAVMVTQLLQADIDVNDFGKAGYQEPPYGFFEDYNEEPSPFAMTGPPLFDLPIMVAIYSHKEDMIKILAQHRNNKVRLDIPSALLTSPEEMIGRYHKQSPIYQTAFNIFKLGKQHQPSFSLMSSVEQSQEKQQTKDYNSQSSFASPKFFSTAQHWQQQKSQEIQPEQIIKYLQHDQQIWSALQQNPSLFTQAQELLLKQQEYDQGVQFKAAKI